METGYTKEQIQEMRGWLDDCFGHDSFFDPDDLTDEEIVKGVKRYYEGGLRQFFLDIEPVSISRGCKNGRL